MCLNQGSGATAGACKGNVDEGREQILSRPGRSERTVHYQTTSGKRLVPRTPVFLYTSLQLLYNSPSPPCYLSRTQLSLSLSLPHSLHRVEFNSILSQSLLSHFSLSLYIIKIHLLSLFSRFSSFTRFSIVGSLSCMWIVFFFNIT